MGTNCRMVYSWKQITKSPLGCGAERMRQMVVDDVDAMAASEWASYASVGETYHGSDFIVEVVDDEN